jgi:ATP-dependent RNA helicase DeaD
MNNLTFENFNIDEKILNAIKDLGYKTPSEVQKQVIPIALEDRDIIVKSQTGSGKTASFAIPLCQKVEIEERDPQALVLSPTRELAVQIKEDITNIGRYKRVRCSAIYGKQPMEIQTNELKQRVHVIVGTPGRTLDHISRGNIRTHKIKYLIIDEADEMLNMGFIDQIEKIINALPKNRITMLFSATLPEKIEDVCKEYLLDPSKIEITPEKLTVEKIDQFYYEVEDYNKFDLLNRILYINNPDSCIIFCKTKENVEKLSEKMKSINYSCMELHGGMDQGLRLEIMKNFKRGAFRFLVTTDVAARGIDIDDISLVINYDVPVEKERYIHRIGRTGRAGKYGTALTFVTAQESRLFNDIEQLIGSKIMKKDIPSVQEANSCKRDFIKKSELKPSLKKEKGVDLNKNITKLYIGAGKDKKIRAGDIVGAITSIEGITADDIGIINIQERYSHVDILGGKGRTVLDSLKTSKIKGKSVKIDFASK